MAKGTAKEIVGKGLTQESLPHRLKFKKAAELNNIILYNGLLSTCALTFACFGEFDKPLEFFLTVNTKTGEAKVTPKV